MLFRSGDEVGAIVFIITNDDLYQFLGDEWKNYKLYQESISDIEKEMDDFLDTS